MSSFADQAQRILEAARTAVSRGEPCSDMTILIGADGQIQMLANSDWPLESLARERSSRAAYRVTANHGRVRVEGREGSQSCLLEASTTARTARVLMAGRH